MKSTNDTEVIVLADFPDLIDLENKILNIRKKVKHKKVSSREATHLSVDCSGVHLTSAVLNCIRRIDLKFTFLNVNSDGKKLIKKLFVKNVLTQTGKRGTNFS